MTRAGGSKRAAAASPPCGPSLGEKEPDPSIRSRRNRASLSLSSSCPSEKHSVYSAALSKHALQAVHDRVDRHRDVGRGPCRPDPASRRPACVLWRPSVSRGGVLCSPRRQHHVLVYPHGGFLLEGPRCFARPASSSGNKHRLTDTSRGHFSPGGFATVRCCSPTRRLRTLASSSSRLTSACRGPRRS